MAANNQPLVEGQAVYTGTNDFTIRLKADDPNPEDTLQYQIKLNGTIKKDWTSIARNSPVDYTFRASDYINDRNQFEVSLRDNSGEVTTFSAILVKVDRPKTRDVIPRLHGSSKTNKAMFQTKFQIITSEKETYLRLSVNLQVSGTSETLIQ
ncbi:hypothetical protein [Brevibacillus borstelensis]|uniref:hypothetical protein n=1 Tax=Brevibacillus borstelensis TaxID=45462 RepID=UPI0030C0AE6F